MPRDLAKEPSLATRISYFDNLNRLLVWACFDARYKGSSTNTRGEKSLSDETNYASITLKKDGKEMPPIALQAKHPGMHSERRILAQTINWVIDHAADNGWDIGEAEHIDLESLGKKGGKWDNAPFKKAKKLLASFEINVFSELHPCGDESEDCCKLLRETLSDHHRIYYRVDYDRGKNSSRLRTQIDRVEEKYLDIKRSRALQLFQQPLGLNQDKKEEAESNTYNEYLQAVNTQSMRILRYLSHFERALNSKKSQEIPEYLSNTKRRILKLKDILIELQELQKNFSENKKMKGIDQLITKLNSFEKNITLEEAKRKRMDFTEFNTFFKTSFKDDNKRKLLQVGGNLPKQPKNYQGPSVEVKIEHDQRTETAIASHADSEQNSQQQSRRPSTSAKQQELIDEKLALELQAQSDPQPALFHLAERVLVEEISSEEEIFVAETSSEEGGVIEEEDIVRDSQESAESPKPNQQDIESINEEIKQNIGYLNNLIENDARNQLRWNDLDSKTKKEIRAHQKLLHNNLSQLEKQFAQMSDENRRNFARFQEGVKTVNERQNKIDFGSLEKSMNALRQGQSEWLELAPEKKIIMRNFLKSLPNSLNEIEQRLDQMDSEAINFLTRLREKLYEINQQQEILDKGQQASASETIRNTTEFKSKADKLELAPEVLSRLQAVKTKFNSDQRISGEPNLVLPLVHGYNQQTTDIDLHSQLLKAMSKKDFDEFKNLLSKIFDVNTKGAEGKTLLHAASSIPDVDIRFTKLLLEKGANPYLKDNEGRTSIYNAAQNRKIEILKCYDSEFDMSKIRGITIIEMANSWKEAEKILNDLKSKTQAIIEDNNETGSSNKHFQDIVAEYEIAHGIVSQHIRKFDSTHKLSNT